MGSKMHPPLAGALQVVIPPSMPFETAPCWPRHLTAICWNM